MQIKVGSIRYRLMDKLCGNCPSLDGRPFVRQKLFVCFQRWLVMIIVFFFFPFSTGKVVVGAQRGSDLASPPPNV